MKCGSCGQEVNDITVGQLSLNLGSRTAKCGPIEAVLTRRECDFLAFLMRNAGKSLTRTDIVKGVYGQDYLGLTNIVDVYVKYIRYKLGPGAVQTIRGLGYRIEAA